MKPIIMVVALATLLTGCGGDVPIPTGSIKPPSARLMAAPEPLPDLQEGSDLFTEHARLRASYARETARLQSLQGYARIVSKKKGN